MGYITNTIKAIFGKTESNEINEEKLSPEDKKLLAEMKKSDKTGEIENSFVASLRTENSKSKRTSVKSADKKEIKAKPRVNDTKAVSEEIERDER